MKIYWKVAGLLVVSGALITGYTLKAQKQAQQSKVLDGFDRKIIAHSQDLLKEGREVFRFNPFGDESFWGDTLELHKAIEGSKFGEVGPGLSPAAATAVGLKIDLDALPQSIIDGLKFFRTHWRQTSKNAEAATPVPSSGAGLFAECPHPPGRPLLPLG